MLIRATTEDPSPLEIVDSSNFENVKIFGVLENDAHVVGGNRNTTCAAEQGPCGIGLSDSPENQRSLSLIPCCGERRLRLCHAEACCAKMRGGDARMMSGTFVGSSRQPTNSTTRLCQCLVSNLAFQSVQNALPLRRIDVSRSRKHEVQCAVRVALPSARFPCGIRQPWYHRLASRDVVKTHLLLSERGTVVRGRGRRKHPLTRRRSKEGRSSSGTTMIPRLCAPAETDNAVAARAQRKAPRT